MKPANRREAREQANAAINRWAASFAGIAWIPFSHYVMTAGDITMVVQVGSIYSVDFDRSTVATLFAALAAPLIGSKITNSVLDFVPVLGWLAKSAVAAVVTKVVGRSLIYYFHDCSPLPD